MEWAASVVLGGDLIKAVDCSYRDYLDLLLTCPACKEPVYLCQKYRRNWKLHVLSVKSHFKHFTSKERSSCDNRVNNLTQAEIEKEERRARNQRLKFFKLKVWQILTRSKLIAMEPEEIETLINKKDSLLPEALQHYAEENWNKIYQHGVLRLKQLLEEDNFHKVLGPVIDAVFQLPPPKSASNFTAEGILISHRSVFRSQINLAIQKKIVAEVIEYLSLTMSRKTLEDLIVLAWFKLQITQDETTLKQGHKIAVDIVLYLIQLVSTVVWANEFAGYYEGYQWSQMNDVVQSKRLYCEGMDQVLAGDLDKAIELFTEAIDLNPEDDEAYTARATAHAQLGSYEVAIADCTQAIRLDPKDSLAYTTRAITQFLAGDQEKSLKDFAMAIKANRYDPLPYINRGTVYLDIENYHAAIADFEKAIQLDSDYAYAYEEIAYARIRIEDYAAAIDDFDRVTKLDPNNTSILNDRGICHLQVGNLELATADFTTVITAQPKHPTPYVNRANALRALGRFKEARLDEQRAHELFGQH